MARRPPQPSPQHKWVTTKIVWDKHGNVLEEDGYWYDGPWDLLGGGAMNTQNANAYRIYDDGGGEAASAALAAQDTTATFSVNVDTSIQVRYRVDEVGGADGSSMDDYAIEYSKNGGAFTLVPTSDSGDGIQAATAGLTNNNNTTNRASEPISDPGGTFVAGGQSTDGQVDDYLITASNFTEHVYGIQFIAANIADADEFRFQLSGSGIDNNNVNAHVILQKTSTEKTVTSLLGEIRLSGFQPEAVEKGQYTHGTLNLEGISPGPVTYVYTINPTRGEINFQGFAPTVEVVIPGGATTVTSLLGEIRLEGFQPEAVEKGQYGFGEIHLEGFGPDVDLIRTVDGPANGEINLEGFAATVELFNEYKPDVGILNLEGFAATPAIQREAFPSFGTLHLEGFAATVTAGNELIANALLGTLNLEGFAASVGQVRRASPQLGVVNADGSIALVSIERTARPSVGEAEIEGFAGVVDALLPAVEANILLGEAQLEGFEPSTTVITIAADAQIESRGGGGKYPDYDDELDVILMVIREFLERAA